MPAECLCLLALLSWDFAVVSISITRTGDPRGEVAFVELGSASQAVAVIESLQGAEVGGVDGPVCCSWTHHHPRHATCLRYHYTLVRCR